MKDKMQNRISAGFRVGDLVVEGPTEKRKNGYTVWLCRCSCGGEIELDTRSLQRGAVTDCGCRSAVKPGMLDLTGQRFGKLVCIKPTGEKDKNNSTLWLCRCDCGNTCKAALHQLRAGYKKSCGCLSHPPVKDYVGKKFNMLTVEEYAGKKGGMHYWKCRCDCGNEAVVGQTLLQSGKTKSCGCLRKKSPAKQGPVFKGFVDGTNIGVLKARMNMPPIASNTSGYNGVYLNNRQMWAAQITFKGKTYYLGSYSSIEEAAAARKKGEEMYENFLEWYRSLQEAENGSDS